MSEHEKKRNRGEEKKAYLMAHRLYHAEAGLEIEKVLAELEAYKAGKGRGRKRSFPPAAEKASADGLPGSRKRSGGKASAKEKKKAEAADHDR